MSAPACVHARTESSEAASVWSNKGIKVNEYACARRAGGRGACLRMSGWAVARRLMSVHPRGGMVQQKMAKTSTPGQARTASMMAAKSRRLGFSMMSEET